ncbi:hypothetical protein ACFQY4_15070 [Catellatospora bangladeshensis]|uniref:Uncharacterized protein n=1 Tax=Catellatospora bangladeshensis TaxID=310355 RepID=A0A8J3JI80_9ACTN|nr:hypothetical protein [Catellatospora bangladeshensis]GIF83069.1 hypothetical protein Cba03nite_44180 [Catellatospora bangladeshensis]
MLTEIDPSRVTPAAGAFPDLGEWLMLARTQIDSAERVAEAHQPDNGMCACSRPLPCVQLGSLLRRRAEFERAVAALVGPTAHLPVIPLAVSVSCGRQRRWWRWSS